MVCITVIAGRTTSKYEIHINHRQIRAARGLFAEGTLSSGVDRI